MFMTLRAALTALAECVNLEAHLRQGPGFRLGC